jgi:hypothetical protein
MSLQTHIRLVKRSAPWGVDAACPLQGNERYFDATTSV